MKHIQINLVICDTCTKNITQEKYFEIGIQSTQGAHIDVQSTLQVCNKCILYFTPSVQEFERVNSLTALVHNQKQEILKLEREIERNKKFTGSIILNQAECCRSNHSCTPCKHGMIEG